MLWRAFPPPQLIGRESHGLTAEKQKILHCPLESFPLERERQTICMQNMQIFTFLLARESVLQGNSPGRPSCKRNWREYGDSLFPTAKSLCVEDKIFYYVVLLIKGFGILLPLLAAHSRESLRQNKNNNEFSLGSNSPRTAHPVGIVCSCPKWSTWLLLDPTLDAKSTQLSGKQLLGCCALQMEIPVRLPCYHDQ